MTKYELSITKDYAPDWTVVDSIREFFQNALDQQTVNGDNPMFYEYKDGVFKIGNAKSKLETKSLLLGASSKVGNSETIGQFGEGYKIASLVLSRLGKEVKIYNYGARELWTASIGYSKRYDADLLIFKVDKKYPWATIPDNDLTIEITGITEEEMEDIINSNLHMQNYECAETPKGEILLDDKHRGMMFVNGLHITDTRNFNYGYNFKPSMIKLDRDRKLIKEFDLEWTTSEIWANAKSDELKKLASELIKKGAPDVNYINSRVGHSMNDISKEVLNDFKNTYGENAVPVSTQDEIELIPSNYKPVIVNPVIKQVINNSSYYVAPKPVYIPTLLDKVELWLITHGDNIKRDARRELSNIIENEKKENKEKKSLPF